MTKGEGKRANYAPETGLFVGLTFDSEEPVEDLDSVADNPDQENGDVEEEEKNEEAGEDNPSSDDVLSDEMD